MTRAPAYRALTLAFVRSLLNNRFRLLLAAVGVVIAVNGIYQAPQLMSNLSQRTVTVAIVPGTDAALAKELRSTTRVRALEVRDIHAARAELASGRADAAVSDLAGPQDGVLVDSAGIFGEVASKTVATVAHRRQLVASGVPYEVVERRDSAHGQLLALMLPALLTVTLLSAATLAFGSLSALRSSGMLQRLRVSGVTPMPLLAAVTTANFILTGVAMVVLIVSATVRTGSAPLLLPLVATALLGFTLLSSAGLLLASRFKNAQNAASASGFVFAMLTLPGVVPVPNLSSSAAKWAITVTPTGSMTEAFRAALQGADAQPLSVVLPIAAAWTLLLTVLAARFFRWENERG